MCPTLGSTTAKEQNRTEHNVRTRNFYHTTPFASAVSAMVLSVCLSVCFVASRSSAKSLNTWLRTSKFRPVCDVHRFSFIDDFSFHYKRFTCKRNQILYLPLYMFCCMMASVSGLMALLVLWFVSFLLPASTILGLYAFSSPSVLLSLRPSWYNQCRRKDKELSLNYLWY